MHTNAEQITERPATSVDILWGVDEIAEAIRQNRAQTWKLLNSGHLPAKQLGKRWCASRKELQRFFGEVAA